MANATPDRPNSGFVVAESGDESSKPSATRRRTAGTAPAAAPRRPRPAARRPRRPATPSGSSPSQAPTRPASAVSTRDRPLQSAALLQPDHARVGRRRATRTAPRSRPARPSAGRPAGRRRSAPSSHSSAASTRRPSAPRPSATGPECSSSRRTRWRAAAESTGRRRVITPKPIASTPRLAKSSSQAAYIERVRREPGRLATVAGPGLGVLRRVLHLALDHPAVQPAGVEPAADPLAPGLAADVLPVAQQLRRAAGRQDRPTSSTSRRTTSSPARPPSR